MPGLPVVIAPLTAIFLPIALLLVSVRLEVRASGHVTVKVPPLLPRVIAGVVSVPLPRVKPPPKLLSVMLATVPAMLLIVTVPEPRPLVVMAVLLKVFDPDVGVRVMLDVLSLMLSPEPKVLLPERVMVPPAPKLALMVVVPETPIMLLLMVGAVVSLRLMVGIEEMVPEMVTPRLPPTVSAKLLLTLAEMVWPPPVP